MEIDLEKYAGHTPGPWTACILDKPIKDVAKYVADCIAQSGGKDFYFVSGNMADGPADICHVGNGPAGPVNVQLIADAPALLAEVVRLRADLAEAVAALRRVLETLHAEAAATLAAEVAASNYANPGQEIVAMTNAMVAASQAESEARAVLAKHGGSK